MANGSGFLKAAKLFGKTHKVLNTATEKTAGKLADVAAAGIEKGAVGAYKGLTKKVDPKLGNFYTGVEVNALGSTLFPVAGVAVGVGMYMKNTVFGPKPGVVSYGGEPPVMAGDGVANTNAPTLNASGNMVFGLHNARKG